MAPGLDTVTSWQILHWEILILTGNTHAQTRTRRQTSSSTLRVIPPLAVSVFCLVLSSGFQETFASIWSAEQHDLFKHKDTPKSFGFEVIRQRAFSGVMAVFFVCFLKIWGTDGNKGKKSSQKWEQYTPGNVLFVVMFQAWNTHNVFSSSLSPCVFFCLFLSQPLWNFLYFPGCYCRKTSCSHPLQNSSLVCFYSCGALMHIRRPEMNKSGAQHCCYCLQYYIFSTFCPLFSRYVSS